MGVNNGMATPSKVRFEIESLWKQHLIDAQDKTILLESAERCHNHTATQEILHACQNIRILKSRSEVHLIEEEEFDEHKDKIIESVKKMTEKEVRTSRRGQSYTRQLMAAMAKSGSQPLNVSARPNSHSTCAQSSPGKTKHETTQSRQAEQRGGRRPSVGDGEDIQDDAALEMLRAMGVEVHSPSTSKGSRPRRPSVDTHKLNDPSAAAQRTDGETSEPRASDGTDFRRGQFARVSEEPSAVESPWFQWNLHKQKKCGHIGRVTNTFNIGQSARIQLEFEDALRFEFPPIVLTVVPEADAMSSGERQAPQLHRMRQLARIHDITNTDSSWTPGAVGQFVQQLGKKKVCVPRKGCFFHLRDAQMFTSPAPTQ